MKNLNELNSFRVKDSGHGWNGDDRCGAFRIPFESYELSVIASSDLGWDHVSVSLRSRCPRWIEMEFIKRLFFKEDETAMQLHVPVKQHINFHPCTLHLWRSHTLAIELPPQWMV